MLNTATATLVERQCQWRTNRRRRVSKRPDEKRCVSKDCDAGEMQVDSNVSVTDVVMEDVDEVDDEKADTTGEGKDQAMTTTAPSPVAATTDRGVTEVQGRAGEAAQTLALNKKRGLASIHVCLVGEGVNCKRNPAP